MKGRWSCCFATLGRATSCELRNALRYALAVSDDGIFTEHLPPEITTDTPIIRDTSDFYPQGFASGDVAVDSFGRGEMPEPVARLRGALWRNKWNITAVAAELGLCRTSVYRQMKRFGLRSTHM